MGKLLQLLLLISMGFLTACGGSSGGGDGEKKASKASIIGAWNGVCIEASEGESVRTVYIFSESGFEWQIKSYFDSSCSLEKRTLDMAFGNIDIKNPLTTSSGLSANEFNWSYIEFLGSSYNEKKYDIYMIDNGKLYFGDTDGRYDASSEEDRPVSLNFERYYTKS